MLFFEMQAKVRDFFAKSSNFLYFPVVTVTNTGL